MNDTLGLTTLMLMLCVGNVSYAAESTMKEPQTAGQPSSPAIQRSQCQQQIQARQAQVHPQQGQEQRSGLHGSDQQQAASAGRETGTMASGFPQTLKGEFIRMEDQFYVIKDANGKEVCIPTSYATFIDQAFVSGATIEARLEPDGTAAVIRRILDPQPSTAGSQDKSMTAGVEEQPAKLSESESENRSSDKPLMGGQQNPSVVKGELLKIEGEFYTLKDPSGKEVRLHVNNETKMSGTFQAGDKIEAEKTSSGHALSIKKAHDSGAGIR